MAKSNKKKATPAAEAPRPAMIQAVRWISLAIAIAGVAVVVLSNRGGQGRYDWPFPGGDLRWDWIWYAGVAVAIMGGVAWFLSGMPREQAIEWIKSGLFALGLALLIRWPIAEPYRIPSGSMEPTLNGKPEIFQGDRVFVNKWIYGVRYPFMNKRIWYGQDPQRWDIVVFKTVEKNVRHKTLVKRIVGMPGERIEIRGGKVYADGVALEPPDSMPDNMHYTSPRSTFSQMKYGVRPEDEYAVVPEGHYLVMGDNSANSRDGRYFGWLPNEHMVGRVASIWWPPNHWTDFTGFAGTWWWRVLVNMVLIALFVRLFIGRSWVVLRKAGRGLDHLFINYAALGLRIPFTPYWIARWGRLNRGDTVLYRTASEEAPRGHMFVGHVAGLPGERVGFHEGRLEVNGEPAAELAEADFSATAANAPYGRSKGKDYSHVPEGHYFVLWETRKPEEDGEEEPLYDSRAFGWISRGHLLGKATALWWPPTRWRKL